MLTRIVKGVSTVHAGSGTGRRLICQGYTESVPTLGTHVAVTVCGVETTRLAGVVTGVAIREEQW